MEILYFDCFSGISGDMTLGAFIDLGVNRDSLLTELGKLNLTGYEIKISKKTSYGLAGTDVEVILQEQHEHDTDLATGRRHGRSLRDIEGLLASSGLNERVRKLSREVFREIARAEAKVHNKLPEEVHFHEVGAVDSIVDIVGAAICLDLLGWPWVYASPLHEGQGFIQCRHGLLPVPVPAVMAMLEDSQTPIPVITEEVQTELVTPTGLGLLKCLTSSFGPMPAMTVRKVGYGLGKRETGRFNALRLVQGALWDEKTSVLSSEEVSLEKVSLEKVVVLETNVDDMSGEMVGYLTERLLELGALDVYHTPIYMKKNRPGVMLSVLVRKNDEKGLVACLFNESSTLGVRRRQTERYCLDRHVETVDIGIGTVKVKVAAFAGNKKISPEYEDCRRLALSAGLPLREVYQKAIKAFAAQGL